MSDAVRPPAGLDTRPAFAVGHITAGRALRILLTALLTTGIWAIILHVGGVVLGSPVPANLLPALLAVIFLLLVVGLAAMAAAAAD